MNRSEASRINGAKSQGPVTPEGKARSSMNALTHGLTAADICIAVENPDEFNKFQQEYFDEFQPQTRVERDLVTELISARWRQERLWSFDAAIIDFRMEYMKPELDQQWILPPRTRAAIAVMEEAAPSGSHSPQIFARYDAMLSRMYHRALRTLTQLRAARVPEPVQQPEPEPVEQSEPVATPSAPTPRPVQITVLQNEPADTPFTPDPSPANDSPADPAAPPLPRAA